jgi:hypothetical protein
MIRVSVVCVVMQKRVLPDLAGHEGGVDPRPGAEQGKDKAEWRRFLRSLRNLVLALGAVVLGLRLAQHLV